MYRGGAAAASAAKGLGARFKKLERVLATLPLRYLSAGIGGLAAASATARPQRRWRSQHERGFRTPEGVRLKKPERVLVALSLRYLSAVEQLVIGQHQRQHRLCHRHAADTDARIVPALGAHFGRLAGAGDRRHGGED